VSDHLVSPNRTPHCGVHRALSWPSALQLKAVETSRNFPLSTHSTCHSAPQLETEHRMLCGSGVHDYITEIHLDSRASKTLPAQSFTPPSTLSTVSADYKKPRKRRSIQTKLSLSQCRQSSYSPRPRLWKRPSYTKPPAIRSTRSRRNTARFRRPLSCASWT
jgi:hypothetical protein